MSDARAGLQRDRPWIDVLWIVAAAAVVFGAGMGLRNPWPADEPVYALIARDMLAHGQWLIPMAGGDFFQDKPPLLFWLIAASDWLTGSLKAGFLLPSLLAGVGCLLLVYDLARRLWTREVGLVAAFALLTIVQFTLQSRRAQMDALLMFFTLLSLYCLCRQLLLGGGWRWALLAGAAAGFGVLAKMVGFLSFFVLLPWLFAVWRGWPGVRWQRPWLFWAGAAASCAAVVAIWLVPLLLAAERDPAIAQYAHEVLIEQTLGRYASPWHHYHAWHYYLTLFIPLWMPLTLLLPWLVPGWLRALRARDARVLLLLGWTVLYVAFFSLSSGKRDVYILTAVPGFALAAAPQLPGLLARRGVQRTLLGFLLVLAVALAGAWVFLTVLKPERGARLLADGGLTSLVALLVVAALAVVAAAVFRLRRAALAVGSFFASVWIVLGLWVFPQMDGERSGADFSARLESRADPRRPLALVEYRENMLWNLRRATVNFGHRRFREGEQEVFDAAAWLQQDTSRQLLVSATSLARCFAAADVREPMGEAGGIEWWLVSGRPAPDCASRGDAGKAILYGPEIPLK
jgi:4-amino-4-deoxy-L-arabinose transferase-like glycosyltransferase